MGHPRVTRIKKLQKVKEKGAGARDGRMLPKEGVQRTIRPRGQQFGARRQPGAMMPYAAARNIGGNQRDTRVWGPGPKEYIQCTRRVSGEARCAKKGTEKEMQGNGRASSGQPQEIGGGFPAPDPEAGREAQHDQPTARYMLAAREVRPSSCCFRRRRRLAGASCHAWPTRTLGGCEETRKKGRRPHGRESRASFIDQGAKSRGLCAYHRPIWSAALDVIPIGPHPFLRMSGYYPLLVSDKTGRRRRLPVPVFVRRPLSPRRIWCAVPPISIAGGGCPASRRSESGRRQDKPSMGAESKSYFRRIQEPQRCWRYSEKREGSREDKAGLLWAEHSASEYSCILSGWRLLGLSRRASA